MKNLIIDFLTTFGAKLKRAHRSATIQFNAACEAANEVLPYLLPYLVAHFPELQGYMPSEAFTNVMRFILVANMLYRFKTTKSLAEK